MDWRRSFRPLGVQALRLGAKNVKPTAAPPVFSAAEMRSEWDVVWKRVPKGTGHAVAWREQATRAGMKPVPTRQWVPPTFERFLEAIHDTAGAPGFDGWTKDEFKAFVANAPWLIQELHSLLIRTTRESPFGVAACVRDALLAWRIVGIPKRDPGESRPIAIASFFIRAWQKTILDALPKAPEDQWCERGVLPATATFLAWQDDQPAAGAELHLAKAYDSVLHGPAAEALRFEGTPPEIVAWLCLAWTAERLCHVGGELADPIDPSSGILPCDPTSGRVLSVLLKPWHSLVKADGVFIGAYADDRSVKAVAGSCTEAAALVDRALATTCSFRRGGRPVRKRKKRQRWQGNQKVEHLGFTLPLGGDASASVDGSGLPAPRDGWDFVLDAIKRLLILPGGFAVRAGIAATCITSKFRWAAPLIAQPPAAIAHAMKRTLLRTNCTWWCQARFWVENVHLHPNLAVAIHALKAAVGLARSALLDDAVTTHAAVLDVEPCRNAQGLSASVLRPTLTRAPLRLLLRLRPRAPLPPRSPRAKRPSPPPRLLWSPLRSVKMRTGGPLLGCAAGRRLSGMARAAPRPSAL